MRGRLYAVRRRSRIVATHISIAGEGKVKVNTNYLHSASPQHDRDVRTLVDNNHYSSFWGASLRRIGELKLDCWLVEQSY